MTILVTGAAGFIGYHVAAALLAEGHEVIGVDSHNGYYDPRLKSAREAGLLPYPGYRSVHASIEEPGLLTRLFAQFRPEYVIHLAAQAGVRYSVENPRAYVDANLLGCFELLEAARAHPPQHLLMASSSSVYGANIRMPFRETDKTDLPLSIYAASKKANEDMAHSYAHLFDLPISIFRFFTVYGPWGRPDMAPYLFASALFDQRPIRIFNHGRLQRDFTYVDDLVRALQLLMQAPPRRPEGGIVAEGDSLSPVAPWRIVNIGNGQPVKVLDFVWALERASHCRAMLDYLPMQAGDVEATWADTSLLRRLTGFVPKTTIDDGAAAYIDWFRDYYQPSDHLGAASVG